MARAFDPKNEMEMGNLPQSTGRKLHETVLKLRRFLKYQTLRVTCSKTQMGPI